MTTPRNALIGALFAALAGTLPAAQFTASYLFDDSSAIHATFSGVLDGNRITGITDVIAEVTGTWWEYNTGPHVLNAATEGAEMTLDGSYMHFSFYTGIEVPDGEDPWDQNVKWCAFTDYAHTSIYYYQAGGNFVWDASRWSVSVFEEQPAFAPAFASFARFSAAPPSVPDGGSVAVMATLALAGMAAARRRVSP